MTEKEQQIIKLYDKIKDLYNLPQSKIDGQYYIECADLLKYIANEYDAVEDIKKAWNIFKEAYNSKRQGKYSIHSLLKKINEIISICEKITNITYTNYFKETWNKAFDSIKSEEEKNNEKRNIKGIYIQRD